MSGQCFPSYSANSKSIKIKLDLCNYAIKTDLKNLNADTSSFALKTNLADLKTKVDKIDFGKINNIDDHQVKNYIEQNYLFFEPRYKYFKTSVDADGTNVLSWESKGLSDENIIESLLLSQHMIHNPY